MGHTSVPTPALGRSRFRQAYAACAGCCHRNHNPVFCHSPVFCRSPAVCRDPAFCPDGSFRPASHSGFFPVASGTCSGNFRHGSYPNIRRNDYFGKNPKLYPLLHLLYSSFYVVCFDVCILAKCGKSYYNGRKMGEADKAYYE